MRAVVQRVARAAVRIGGHVHSAIGPGLLVLAAVEAGDTPEAADWLAAKIARLRVFSDDAGLMNRSVQEIQGGLIVVSQFTLLAGTRKGNRPSFDRAARPPEAVPLYQHLVRELARHSGITVGTGVFGADMQVELVNDGPVTILIDTRLRE
jgi:D-tyrosyl-tRNA(Tyr) deacylase